MLGDIISVVISVASSALAALGFGVPLILGPSDRFAELYQEFTQLSDMLTAGFLITDPEYLAASALLSQAIRPKRFLVGRRSVGAPVAQVTTVTIANVVNSRLYTVTINGIVFSYTSDASALNTEIRDGLIAAINLGSEPVTAASATATTFTLTADQAGVSFTVSVSDDLTTTATTPNANGISADLQAIQDAGAAWYATILAERNDGEIEEAAVWTETAVPVKILLAQSNNADAPATAYDSAAPSDIAERLKARGFNRTALWWHDDDAEHVNAAIAGRCLPLTPGSETWALKRLTGPTPTLGVGAYAALPIPSTQLTNLRGNAAGPGGKNANVYYAVTDELSMTSNGTMASGRWIDEIRLLDAIIAEISTGIANVQLDNDKVPMDADGAVAYAAPIHGTLQRHQRSGGVAKTPPYTVTIPDVLVDVSQANRAARVFSPGPSFTFRLAGAIHQGDVAGQVAP